MDSDSSGVSSPDSVSSVISVFTEPPAITASLAGATQATTPLVSTPLATTPQAGTPVANTALGSSLSGTPLDTTPLETTPLPTPPNTITPLAGTPTETRRQAIEGNGDDVTPKANTPDDIEELQGKVTVFLNRNNQMHNKCAI